MQDLIDMLGGADVWQSAPPPAAADVDLEDNLADTMPELYIDQLRLMVEKQRQREIEKGRAESFKDDDGEQEDMVIGDEQEEDQDESSSSSDVDDGTDPWFNDDKPEDPDVPLKERRLTKAQIRKKAEKALGSGDTFLGDPDEVRRFFSIVFHSEDSAMNVLHMHAALHGYYYARHREYPLKRSGDMVRRIIYNCSERRVRGRHDDFQGGRMINCRSRVALKMSLLSGRREFMFETDKCDFRHTCKRSQMDKNRLMIEDSLHMNETDAERELRRFIESRPEATLSVDDPSLASFEKLIRFIAENKPYAGVRDGIWWDPHILWAIKNAGSGGGRYPALINSSMPVPVSEQGSKNYFGDHYSLRSRTTGWAYGSSGANFFQFEVINGCLEFQDLLCSLEDRRYFAWWMNTHGATQVKDLLFVQLNGLQSDVASVVLQHSLLFIHSIYGVLEKGVTEGNGAARHAIFRGGLMVINRNAFYAYRMLCLKFLTRHDFKYRCQMPMGPLMMSAWIKSPASYDTGEMSAKRMARVAVMEHILSYVDKHSRTGSSYRTLMYGVNDRAFVIYNSLPELIYWISDTDHDSILRTELFFSACNQSTAKRASDIMYNCLASFIYQKRTHWIDHYAAEELMRHFQANYCLRNNFPYAYAVLLDTVNGWDPFHLVAHPVLSRLPYEVRTKAARELENRDMKDFMPHYFLYELVFETQFLPVYVKKMLARGLFCLENRHPRLFSLPPVPTEHNRSTLAAIMACAKRMEDKQRAQEEQDDDDDDDDEEIEQEEHEEDDEDDDDDEEEDMDEDQGGQDDEEVVFVSASSITRKRGRPRKLHTMPRGGQRCKERERRNRQKKRNAPKTFEVHQGLMKIYQTDLVKPGNPSICDYVPFTRNSSVMGNLRGLAILMDFFDFIHNDAKHLGFKASAANKKKYHDMVRSCARVEDMINLVSGSVNLPVLSVHEGNSSMPSDILYFEDCLWLHPWTFNAASGDVTVVALEMATLVRDTAYVELVSGAYAARQRQEVVAQ